MSTLLERERERELLAAALDGAHAGRGAVIVVEGEAGAGKSALVGLAAGLADQRGMRVALAHGGVLEQEVAWGVVRQLFEPLVLATDGVLDGPARAAAPVFGPPAPLPEPSFPVDLGATLEHALFRVAVALATRMPLLVAVDDAHWADEASLRWLVYLARRVERLPIAVLAARRVGEPATGAPLHAELAAVRGMRRLRPAPLSEQATAALAGEVLGAQADLAFTRACREITGGNPFFLRELLGELAATGTGPTAAAEPLVRSLRPERVVAEVTRRLAGLSDEAVALARAVAVLEGSAELRHAVALAGLPFAAGQSAADELTLARLLRPGRPLRFVHPILRAAVEAELPPARRAAAHRHAGALLDGEPALVDRAAAHLLACEPAADPWVAERLLAAGERAMARGAPASAVRLLERARREPCEEPSLQLALGRAYRLVGRLTDAARELGGALAVWPSGSERDAVVRELATALAMNGRGEEAVGVLERELARLPADARERRRLLAVQLGLGMLLDGLVVDASERVEREAATLPGETVAERMLLGSLALIRARRGTQPAAEAADIAERALAGGLAGELAPETFLATFVSFVLIAADRDADAERWIERSAADARRRGAQMTLATTELGLARVHRFRGELSEARRLVASSLDRALLGSAYGRLVAGGTLVSVLVDSGALEEADELLDELGLGGSLAGLGAATTVLRARMALRSAQGRHAAALADADELLARLERRRHGGPGPLGEAALVALAAGDRERARAHAAEELERARRWDTASALGVARWQLGLTLGDEDGLGLLQEAVTTLSATPCRLELARAQLSLGAALRRRNRRSQARRPLQGTLDLATRCGAAAVAETARVELRACGARPRRALLSGPASLTASERRVAELAARGLSNSDIARTLVVSRSTVETHLRAAYRKLSVRSRGDLAPALDEQTSPSLRDANGPPAGASLRP